MQERLETLIRTAVTGLGYELWGYEYRVYGESALLRIFIDSPAGITVDDCGRVSEQIGAALDVEDLIPVAYMLEVSSPGVDRVLFEPHQYQRYLGQKIKVRTRVRINALRNFVGTLLAADDTKISVQMDAATLDVPYEAIDRGRLVYVPDTTPRKGKSKGKRA
ncbi:ribosome maturation factor RimP [Thiolinea disciformis]|uniref:ribosome maturation factor RimP n=1 Tax=Thiolinea disciformis TaxID=125614 RepID=UPI0003796E6B|nr:ribosome maturation factor RimP [Thiolinea disciformis]